MKLCTVAPLIFFFKCDIIFVGKLWIFRFMKKN